MQEFSGIPCLKFLRACLEQSAYKKISLTEYLMALVVLEVRSIFGIRKAVLIPTIICFRVYFK